MKSWHYNGEEWYERNWSVFHRIRHWFVWIGGWEKANGEGWKLIRGDNLKSIFKYKKYKRLFKPEWWLYDPFPVSFCGHRLIFQPWGFKLRVGDKRLVYSKHGQEKPVLYLSYDGTPAKSMAWYLNPPQEILAEVKHKKVEKMISDVERKLRSKGY